MTDLEKSVAHALRLSTNAATLLLEEIDRNIAAAKAELKRAGVNAAAVDAEGALVTEAIVTYCLMNMGDETRYERYFTAFQYQQDNLRRSVIEVEETPEQPPETPEQTSGDEGGDGGV